MGLRKQKVMLTKYMIFDEVSFIVEVYRLSTGGKDEDQRYIVAGGG